MLLFYVLQGVNMLPTLVSKSQAQSDALISTS
jgi:hypothetical protein